MLGVWPVERLAVGWTVRASNASRVRLSVPVQAGAGAHPAACKMCTASLSRVKEVGAWC